LTSASPWRFRPLLILAAIVALAVPLSALELPVRSFTTADGLGDNRVKRIVLDSRGLLWICTNSGISRFDGAQFQNFGVTEGLPFSIINDLLETADGDFWLASNGGGVIRVRLSSAEPRFEMFSVSSEPTSNRVNLLYRGTDGTIWAGTDGGLFRMSAGPTGRPLFTRVGLQRRGHPDEMVQVWSFASDREGALWVGTRFGLVRFLPGGRVVSYPLRQDLETDHVFSLLYTPEDDVLWIGHQSGLAIVKPPPVSSYSSAQRAMDQPFEDRAIARAAAGRLRLQNGSATLPQSPGDAVYFDTSQLGGLPPVAHLLRSRSGAIRIVSNAAALEFSAGRFTMVEDSRFHKVLTTAAEDQDGNLWVGTQAAGVLRVARRGFLTFRESDGLGQSVGSVFEDRAGDLVVISQDGRISRFDGERFQTVRANIPASARAGWRGDQSAIQDRHGDWWFPTGAGLVRFSGIRRIEDLATTVPTIYTTRDGLAQDSINRVFEDARGDIWSAGRIPGREVLTRWDRGSGHFQTYSDADGLRAFNAPSSFYEDPHGILFITLRDGGIARYDGRRFRILSDADGLPPGNIGGGIADRAGRLWCWSALGLYRLDDLNAPRLRRSWSRRPGSCIAERSAPWRRMLLAVSTCPPGKASCVSTTQRPPPNPRFLASRASTRPATGWLETKSVVRTSIARGGSGSARRKGCPTSSPNHPGTLPRRRFVSVGCALPMPSRPFRLPARKPFLASN
jgi:ligand-binding sensor domain-containing protein